MVEIKQSVRVEQISNSKHIRKFCSFSFWLQQAPVGVFWLHILDLFRKQEDRYGIQIKSEFHRKKDRQRNLLPAKTGIFILIISFFVSIIYFVLYGMMQNVDVYTRSYYLGFINDFFPCFISPIIVVFEAPVIRRKINNSFSMLSQTVLMGPKSSTRVHQ